MDEANKSDPSQNVVPTRSSLLPMFVVGFSMLLLGLGGGYLLFSNKTISKDNDLNQVAQVSPKVEIKISPTPEEINKWEIYESKKYLFQYPSSWNILKTGDLSLRLGPLGSEKIMFFCNSTKLPRSNELHLNENNYGWVLKYAADFNLNGMKGLKKVTDASNGANTGSTFTILLANSNDDLNCGFGGSLGRIDNERYEASLDSLTIINRMVSSFKFKD